MLKVDNQNLNSIEKLTSNLTLDEAKNRKNTKSETDLLKGESSAVIAGAKIIKDKGYKIDRETIKNLKEFLDGDTKEWGSKLNALKTAIEKDIPLKEPLLSRIQINTDLSLLDFLKSESQGKKSARKDKHTDSRNLNQPRSYERVEKSESLLKKISEIIDKAEKKSTTKDDFHGKEKKVEGNFLGETLNFREKSDLEKGLEYDIEEIQKEIEQLFKEENTESFDETLGNHLASLLNLSEDLNYKNNISMVLEVKITQKIINLKNDFSNLKKELNINLFKIADETNNLTKEDRLTLLYKSIERLDSTIMKSDLSLYMDLKGERELIRISSDLQIAKKHLENGEYKKAESIFKMAKQNLDSLKFEPSIKKAFALVGDFKINQDTSVHNLDKWIRNSAETFSNSEKSVSSLVNYLRKMGINNDVEQFQNTQNNKEVTRDLDIRKIVNLKEILLKINDSSHDNKSSSKAGRILQSIEGNQLKNKILDNKLPQTVELEIPINLSGQIKNVKVFIKSPERMLKLDWENFDMYFLLNSPNYGEMGIRVSAIQRKLSVKIINDNTKNIRPEKHFGENFKDELETFGYTLVRMVMEAWNQTEDSDAERNSDAAPIQIPKDSDGLSIDIKI